MTDGHWQKMYFVVLEDVLCNLKFKFVILGLVNHGESSFL